MVEMANPGVHGLEHLGRTRESLPVVNKLPLNGQQQVSSLVYEHLSGKILKGYGVFGNVLVNDKSVVIQATYWDENRYSRFPSVAVGLNMVVNGGRPISALFFASKKTLILNVHSVHFRKTLINTPKDFGQDKITKAQNFGMMAFNTKRLRELYGTLLTDKIVEALEFCAEKPNEEEGPAQQIYCQGMVGEFIENPSESLREKLEAKLKKEDWTIIAGGDFNDETMELSTFEIFGITVSVRDEQRKRTCCSDRDRDFKSARNGVIDSNDVPLQPNGHTIANLDYMVKDSQYLNGKVEGIENINRTDARNQLQHYMIETLQKNPMSLRSAKKILADGRLSESFSPFPSDMILSNRKGGDIEFPPGYMQRMSKRTAALNDAGKLVFTQANEPVFTEEYEVPEGPEGNEREWIYDSMISDHDPIERMIFF
jgi:hypothetical protein